MYNSLHPDHLLADIRERHAMLRRQAQHSRDFREARHRHRFRTRQRRT
jgi:hypothetical protein